MSSRGGKFFRPAAGGGGSSDEEDEEEDEEEEEEEEEEDDDDDDDYDHQPASRKRKGGGGKSGGKKRKVNNFFDEEAEDEDGEDEDEPYGTHHDPDDIVKKHYTEEDKKREQMDEEARAIMAAQDRRRAREGYGGMQSIEDLARDIEDRHRREHRAVERNVVHRAPAGIDEDGAEVMGGPEHLTAVTQQSLVPSVSDPSLWMISCSTGKEQDLVLQIMNKCVAFARQGKPLGICGAIASQSKGRIYIESYSEPAVVEAIQGVRGLLQYTMRLIPIGDMTTVMTVVNKKRPVKKNEWVRMTRGHYKGDLALVRKVLAGGLKCIVQTIPRLDLTLSSLPPDQARIRRRTVRPPQKFFNSQEVSALGKHNYARQPYRSLDNIYCDYFEGNYYHDGYLLKEMTVGSMIKPCGDEDPPTLDELQQFRRRQKGASDDGPDGDENEGAKMAASLLDELSELQGKTSTGDAGTPGGGLLIGDTVEVIEGDLVGMRGKIVSLDETTVKVKPIDTTDLGGTEEVEFLSNQVRKYIPVGAHVKVTEGRYANETGVVVAVEQMEGETDFTAVVLTDVTNKEISVRTSQLRESAEIAHGQDKLAGYELYDLVVLSGGGSANEVGVIVRVGREDFTVINNHGICRDVRPEELRGKRNSSSSRAVALDVQGSQIRVGDSVNVAEGPHKGKTATIKRMSRAQLFLYSQTRSENAGIFVVRSRSCVLAGSRAQSGGRPGDGGVSPFSTPQSQSRGPPGGRGKRDDGLIGKTVRIQAGQWKGYIGTVSDATATHVQVELHSRLKKVMVVRERVAVAGDKFGSTEGQARTAAPPPSGMAPTTPFNPGGATPMHGGATPMHGGATPMHNDTGGDDVWRPGHLDQTEETNGWGTSNAESNPFGSASADADDGWGSSTAQGGSTWASADNQEDPTGQDSSKMSAAQGGASVKQEQNENGMETGMGDSEETAVWFMERVCVQVVGDGNQGVIKELNSDKTATIEFSDNSTRMVRAGEVSMVPPKEHDMVLVTGGADVGVEGELVCIDGSDAILKDSNEDFKIVDFVHLAKIIGDS